MIKILLKKLRNIIIGDFRSKRLANLVIKKIIKYNKKKNIKILDYGSGFQPVLIFIMIDFLREFTAFIFERKKFFLTPIFLKAFL